MARSGSLFYNYAAILISALSSYEYAHGDSSTARLNYEQQLLDSSNKIYIQGKIFSSPVHYL